MSLQIIPPPQKNRELAKNKITLSIQYLIKEAKREGITSVSNALELAMNLADNKDGNSILFKKMNNEELLVQAHFIIQFLKASQLTQKKFLSTVQEKN